MSNSRKFKRAVNRPRQNFFTTAKSTLKSTKVKAVLFVSGAVIGAGIFALARSGNGGYEERFIPIAASLNPTRVDNYAFHSCDSLAKILSHTTDAVSSAERLAAVRNNISGIVTHDIEGKDYFSSAFMISQSGYFMTTAHSVERLAKAPGANKAVIITFNPQKVYAVNSIVIDNDTDYAVVYAPTGLAHGPIEGIEFSRAPLQLGQKLKMVALTTGSYENQNGFWELISEGKLTDSDAIRSQFPRAKQVHLAVDGMIPFGGSSGSPILDADGRVVGIESSAYGGPHIEDYKGALIVPAKNLDSLVSKCE